MIVLFYDLKGLLMEKKQLPQVLTLAKGSKNGKIFLKKNIRHHLGIKNNAVVFLTTDHEILISAVKTRNARKLQLENSSLRLPDDVFGKFLIAQDSLVGLVERDQAIAIKSFEIEESIGEKASWYDIETPLKIIRVIEKNPSPEVFIKRLYIDYQDLELQGDVRAFIKDRQTLDSMLSRKILGMDGLSDEKLKKHLIQERLDGQRPEGCWEQSIPATARNLRELALLGLDSDHLQINRAVAWLLGRPQSLQNPGLWFATDDLVQKQAEVIERRKNQIGGGTRERFNRADSSKVNLIRLGDPLIEDPCGAKIIWTSALVLEALLMLSLEKEQRMQAAIRTLLTNPHWCDNTYQHGFSTWKRTEPLNIEELKQISKYVIKQYEYGGLSSGEAFKNPEVFEWFPRNSYTKSTEGDIYNLKMPLGIGEGCRIFMVRALCLAHSELLKKAVENNLWNFVANLNLSERSFLNAAGKRFKDQPVFLLQIFSRINLPIAKLAIFRMLPGLIEIQNKDGSWGKEPVKDATTRVVSEAFLSLGKYLPDKILDELTPRIGE